MQKPCSDSKYNLQSNKDYPQIISTIQKGNNGYNNSFDLGTLNENKDKYYSSSFNGTSAAVPSVTGAIALMLEANPKLTFWEIKYILAKSANIKLLNADVEPFCMKIIEKLNIFDSSNDYWKPWKNQKWIKNKAGNSFHNAYGFGLVDANKAVQMSKKFHYPYSTISIKTETEKLILPLATEIMPGKFKDFKVKFNQNLNIMAVNVYPILETPKSDGISCISLDSI